MLEDDRTTLSVFLWNHGWSITLATLLHETEKKLVDGFKYDKSVSFKHSNEVYNVVPGDFRRTGKLDLFVMSRSQTSGSLDLALYPALPEGGFGGFSEDVNGRIKSNRTGFRARQCGLDTCVVLITTNTHRPQRRHEDRSTGNDTRISARKCAVPGLGKCLERFTSAVSAFHDVRLKPSTFRLKSQRTDWASA